MAIRLLVQPAPVYLLLEYYQRLMLHYFPKLLDK